VAVAQLRLVRLMAAALVASAILFAATPTPAPVRVTLSDVFGMWITIRGNCSQGQHLFDGNGEYRMWCFDSISEGKWSLRGGNKIIVKHDPQKPAEEIITVLGFERHSGHTFLYVRYQDGYTEKWMKTGLTSP
jgi:hypothetical protein